MVRRNDVRQTGEVWKINGDTLTGVHLRKNCKGGCPLHSPSDHSMKDFILLWRQDRMFFERICPHGIGHPDPDSLGYIDSVIGPDNGWGIHGCDGCCHGAY